MKTDIQIAKEAKLEKIEKIAEQLNIPEEYLNPYGKYIGKVSSRYYEEIKDNKDGNLILVTAITPTPAGEGKTTTSIGLSMGLNKMGKKSIVALREPSLGPVMGIKGGAAGGGYSQVLPMEDINLHFTGDIHAITTAHNLVSAVIDSHIKFKNDLEIDSTQVFWKRALDMNDRALRNIVVGLGGKTNGLVREDGFIITAASEIMAVLCLSENIDDLKEKLSKIVIARNMDRKPITIGDLKIEGALALILKDALNPNLVQTIDGTPAFIHGGPFANIAHGTNSIIATKMAIKMSDYTVTEAGFGSDLGAEKFLDFVSPNYGLDPKVVVIVATVRALKYHGGMSLKELKKESIYHLRKGLENLRVHIENMRKYDIPVVVAINKFDSDSEEEIQMVENFSEDMGVEVSVNEAFLKGSDGTIDLAEKVVKTVENSNTKFKPIYNPEDDIEEKIEKIATKIYRAGNVEFTLQAKKMIKFFEKYGFDHLPIIIAKTQSSISDDKKKLGAPSGYEFTIRDFELSAGAGFIVALSGEIMRMPGLSKIPNAVNLDIDNEGNIKGLS
ncbi:formate--tetrahydrofolate ligase [Geotoga petraea]|uniref:Formate--tetrahydrofolate ligase n=1 Tax=Geotoga petraea TaxID=28234 RepID=A0A1G6JST4_9BACT|nr:formate--tetrahydrofolate ligase [Geotoga petraea]MDK2945652.1 formate--tetrahydrofolate ligase [Geotoga sp.]SDC21728.1 Formate-tetrahydrofolate ligase [Geotoga petraea]